MANDTDLSFNPNDINQRISFLNSHLQTALQSPTRNFNEINTLGKKGLYLIFKGDSIIYAGKTTRAGKIRLREMISDFRSHTLNNKLL